ncbi:hypothetical protein D3C72_1597860 [compost metagenome]
MNKSGLNSSLRVNSCSIPFAIGSNVVSIKALYSSLSNPPTPTKKAGTPKMPATVRLSNCTVSLIARSFSDNGFTCSTSIISAGTIHGCPASERLRYISNTLSRPASLDNSAVFASTFTISEGMYFPPINPFFVAVACFRLSAISFNTAR